MSIYIVIENMKLGPGQGEYFAAHQVTAVSENSVLHDCPLAAIITFFRQRRTIAAPVQSSIRTVAFNRE